MVAWWDPQSFSNRAHAVSDPAEIDFDPPEVQAAFDYAMNNIGGGLNDLRATSLVDAVRKSLA
nr:hypothetical protein [Streptomyces sp. AC550_RSS872]